MARAGRSLFAWKKWTIPWPGTGLVAMPVLASSAIQSAEHQAGQSSNGRGYGIANVKWRLAGNGPEFIPQPIDVGKFSGAGEGA